jgi:acetyltransferase-like isoleucine patch superfamily enzyme
VYVHPTAIVEAEAIGDGTAIWAYAHIMPGARIGANCNIGDHCFVESGAVIGDNTVVKNGNMIWEGVTLEDGVFVGPHAFFTNDLYPRSRRLDAAAPRYVHKENWLVHTKVGRGAALGAGAIIVGGVTIGEYAMVAAGAVVTKSVPAYALVRGNPARVSGWVCGCGRPLRTDAGTLKCDECASHFAEDNGVLTLLSASYNG